MLYSSLLAIATLAPRTTEWSLGVGGLMTLSCLFAVAIGRYAIQRKGVGPKLPVELPDPFDAEFGVPELIATMCFGHILGAGMILGLSSSGIL